MGCVCGGGMVAGRYQWNSLLVRPTHILEDTLKTSTSSLVKLSFLRHNGLPRKILQDCIRVFTFLDLVTIIFLQSNFVSLASNPQTWGSGLYIYIPVIPPSTGFSFSCLLRPAGLRWRYFDRRSHTFDKLLMKIQKWLRRGPNCGLVRTRH